MVWLGVMFILDEICERVEKILNKKRKKQNEITHH
jgi:hypothetical protein